MHNALPNPIDPMPVKPDVARVLLVDDEVMILQALRRLLQGEGYDVTISERPVEGLQMAQQTEFDVVLVDLKMPQMSGIEFLEALKADQPEVEVVMMTAYGTPENAFRAVKLGAYDWLKKPFENIDEVAHVVQQALEHRRLIHRNRYLEHQVGISERFEDLIGKSDGMRAVFERVESAAPSDASILIQGESGTGKELIARAIHRRSPRATQAMIAVHCGAIAETLLESELFGHTRGAFTGANQTRKGHFEVADGGTIFLDEVGEMSLATQVKLLRVLQEGEIMRVGSSESRRVDVRTIAATNVDLSEATRGKRFREDLFYRLNVIPIRLPPLRERREDIPLLAHHFLAKYAQRSRKAVHAIATSAMDALQAYRWPGNVRELENVIEAAVVLARGEEIDVTDLSHELRLRAKGAPAVAVSGPSSGARIDEPFARAKSLAVSEFERSYVTGMLDRTNGNISEAARRAGLDRSNFRRVMLKYKDEVDTLLNGR